LLLTTTMSARQVVWGKFMAAMVQALVVLVSMLPLVGICFLFGGVSIGQILSNYLFLALLSAILLANALSASSGAKSAQRAVGASYGLPVLAGIILVPFLASLGRGDSIFFELISSYGYLSRSQLPLWSGTVDPVDRVMFVYVIPGFLWAAGISFYFILATQRLMPTFSNRSTAMRIHALAFLGGAWAIGTYLARRELGTRYDAGVLATLSILNCFPALGLVVFATEDPIQPAHLVAAWRRRPLLLRLFGPGPERGVAFGLAVMGPLVILSAAGLASHVGPVKTILWAGVILAWTFAVAAFGRFLVTLLGGRSGPARVLSVLGALVIAAGPMIHWAVWYALERGTPVLDRRDGPLTALLSPVLALFSLVNVDDLEDFPSRAGPLPLAPAFIVSATLAAAVFWFLGSRARRVLERASAPPTPPPS
jgi:hypothetical protein